MRKILLLSMLVALGSSMVGCAYMPTKVNLSEVEKQSGMKNVTTGDGTFENYVATGHYSASEIGISVGILWFKIFEIYPRQTDEELITRIAKDAKGADAMINVEPHSGWFIPLIIPGLGGIGIHYDHASGTAIKLK